MLQKSRKLVDRTENAHPSSQKRALHKVYQLLKTSIDGRVQLARKNSIYCTDFGRSKSIQPLLVVHALSEKDLRKTLKIANTFKIPISVRGAGHSCNGQTLCSGIVVVYCSDKRKIRVYKNKSVYVPACMTWGTLEKALNAHSLSCPVLTDCHCTSVGGTLSVGGIGMRSWRYGAQIDQVLRLRLVLASGKAIWCSPKKHANLFQFALAGLGMLGIIESVVLRTIPYKPFSVLVRSYEKIALNQIPEVFSDRFVQDKNRPDTLDMTEGKIFIHKDGFLFSKSEVTEYTTRSHTLRNVRKNFVFAQNRFTKNSLKPYAKCENYWSDYVLAAENAIAFLKYVLQEAQPILSNLWVIYSLPIKRPNYSPKLPLHFAKKKNRLYISIGLYFMRSPCEDPQISVKIQEFIFKLHQRCLELRGRPYLYGVCSSYYSTMKEFYGKEFNHLVQLKNRYDPNHIFPFTEIGRAENDLS